MEVKRNRTDNIEALVQGTAAAWFEYASFPKCIMHLSVVEDDFLVYNRAQIL